MLLLFLSGISILLVELWLGFWSGDILGLSNADYFQAYFIISIATSTIYLVTQLLFKRIAREGLILIYKEAVDGLLRKKLDFYAKTPVDRIIYRLTKDLLVIDDSFISAVEAILGSVLLIIGGVLILTYATFGIFLIAFFIFGLMLYKKINKNLNINRSLVLLSNDYKSQLQSILMRTLKCIVTLRNLKRENYFDKQYHRINNIYQNAASHLGNASERWLGTRIYLTTTILVTIVYGYVLLYMIVNPDFFVENLWILSFCLNWVNKLGTYSTMFIPNIVAANNHVLAYYRVKEYSLENGEKKKMQKLKVDLKAKAIQLKNVDFRYNKEVKIYKNLNFEVESKEKVCLIGKNGSGRHSMIHLLMKTYESFAQDFKADDILRIFGQDVQSLDPFKLRSKIIYLSSDPVLFYGTVRSNIDPLDIFTDEEIIKALHFMKMLDLLSICDVDQLELTEKEISQCLGFQRQQSFLRGGYGVINEESRFVSHEELPEVSEELSQVSEEEEDSDIEEDEVKKRNDNLGNILEFKSKRRNLNLGNANLRRRMTIFHNRNKVSAEILINSLNEEIAKKKKKSKKSQKYTQKRLWNDFNSYTFSKKERDKLKNFLYTENTKIKNIGIVKLIMATKAFLEKPPILFIDQGGLQIEGLETKNIYDTLWGYLTKSTIIGILSDFDFLLKYDRVCLFENGNIVEDGNPFDMIFSQKSKVCEMINKRNFKLFNKITTIVEQEKREIVKEESSRVDFEG